MKVWVAERGLYDERYVVGVYASADVAIAAHPIPERPNYAGVGAWTVDEEGEWENGLDWGERVTIRPYEVKGPDADSA